MQQRPHLLPPPSEASPSPISTHRGIAARALHADAVLAPTMPARCLTLGSTANFGSKHAMVASPTSGTSHLPAMTSTCAGNGMLHGAGRIGASTSTSCSTYVLSGLREGFVVGASAINNKTQCSTSFPRFGGTNPCLWRVQCLEYFVRFNIQKCMWVVAATMHMEGQAKVWYEAYRLRQAVDDWPEFMDTVEAHFGVEDPPPATPIVGAAHPGLIVLAGTSISPAMPIRSDRKEDDTGDVHELFDDMPLWDPEPQDHTKRHDASEVIADDSAEILTQVGGVSLFRDLVMDSFDEVLEEHLSNDRMWSPWNSIIEGTHFFLEDIPSWRRGNFNPWKSGMFCAHSVLDILPPWRRSDFSPGSRVCTCLRRAIVLSEMMPWLISTARARPIEIFPLDESVGIKGQIYLAVGNSFALVMYCNYQSASLYDSAFFQWEIAWLIRLRCHLSAIRYQLSLMVISTVPYASIWVVLPFPKLTVTECCKVRSWSWTTCEHTLSHMTRIGAHDIDPVGDEQQCDHLIGCLSSVFLSHATSPRLMDCHGIPEAFIEVEFEPLLGDKQCFAGAVV